MFKIALYICLTFFGAVSNATSLKCIDLFQSKKKPSQHDTKINNDLSLISQETIDKLNDPNLTNDDPAILLFDNFLRQKILILLSTRNPKADLSLMGESWIEKEHPFYNKLSKSLPRFDNYLKEAGGFENFMKSYNLVLEEFVAANRSDLQISPSLILGATIMHYRWRESPQFSAKKSSKRSDIIESERLNLQFLAEGRYSKAFLTDFNGQSAVAIFPKDFYPDHDVNNIVKTIESLTLNERAAFARLDKNAIQVILRTDDFDLNVVGLPNEGPKDQQKWERSKQLRKVFLGISNMVANYEYLVSLSKINHRGRSIVPSPIGLLRDNRGVIHGYLMEYLPFPTFEALIKSGKLSKGQISQVVFDVQTQINVLRQNKLSHGDINAGNILVEILPDGSAIAHLIDFVAPENKFPRTSDIHVLEQIISYLKHHNLI